MATMTSRDSVRCGISRFQKKHSDDTPPIITGLTQGMGRFSVALGLTQLVAPKFLGNLSGVRRPWLLQACGAREIANGVGILTSSKPAPWMWGRVAGDAVDLGILSEAYLDGDEDERKRTCISAAAVAGVTALDAICAGKLTASA